MMSEKMLGKGGQGRTLEAVSAAQAGLAARDDSWQSALIRNTG